MKANCHHFSLCLLFRAAYAHIIVGAHHLYNPHDQPNYETMKATKFINHPEYDSKQIANDVALIELPREVTYNGKSFIKSQK